MTESRIEITHRLVGERRWPAACEFRDRVRKEERAAGRKRAEAVEESWRQMAEQFPPLPGPERSPDDIETVSTGHDDSDLPPGGDDFESDLAWAWMHIGEDGVETAHAPNGCAWYLLIFGRQNPERMVQLVVKALGRTGTDAKRLREDRDFQFALLDRINKEFPCPHCGTTP